MSDPFDPVDPGDLSDWITHLAEDPGDPAHDTAGEPDGDGWDGGTAGLVDADVHDHAVAAADDATPDLVLDDHEADVDAEWPAPRDGGDADHAADGEGEPPQIRLDDPDGGDAPATDAADDGSTPSATAGLHSLVETAETLGGDAGDPAEVDALLERVDAPVYGIDGRTAVQVLVAMGVDAHVAHGSIEDLADRLDAGERVLVTDERGQRHAVVEIDFAAGRLVLDTGSERLAVGLAEFVERWSDSTFEMVVAGGADVEVLVPITVGLGGI